MAWAAIPTTIIPAGHGAEFHPSEPIRIADRRGAPAPLNGRIIDFGA